MAPEDFTSRSSLERSLRLRWSSDRRSLPSPSERKQGKPLFGIDLTAMGNLNHLDASSSFPHSQLLALRSIIHLSTTRNKWDRDQLIAFFDEETVASWKRE